jgi:triacylglycerol lipase
MSPHGLVGTPTRVSETTAGTASDLQLYVEEALASTRRLWLRGRLQGGPVNGAKKAGDDSRWWDRWWGKGSAPASAPLGRLEVRLSGSTLQTEVSVLPDGRFEATFEAALAPARRGWRVARNRFSYLSHTAEACGVVLAPPVDAAGVGVVVLPLAYTYEAHGAQGLATSEQASRLTTVLQRLHQGPKELHAVYYLGCVPPEGASPQAELALAMTALGWPHGTLLLLPTKREAAPSAIQAGLDRLRWLFAGSLSLRVLNLEPAAAQPCSTWLAAAEDRAPVRSWVNPEDDPWTLFEDIRPEVPEGRLAGPRPTRASLVPRYPIVFCHGMLAYSALRMQLPKDLNSFSPLGEFLHGRGLRMLFPQVAPTGGVQERARQLREQIRSWTREPVNLIAHSMGGLDARYLITHLDMASQVRSLTTVCTPHRGTFLAEWFLTNFRNRVPLILALEAAGFNLDGFRDCRPAACCEFNATTPDMPGVRYFSFAGEVSHARVWPALRRAWNLLMPIEGPNDGLVSVASAQWGEYLGTMYADHFAQTPDVAFLRSGGTFNILGFYTRLIEDLARRGF